MKWRHRNLKWSLDASVVLSCLQSYADDTTFWAMFPGNFLNNVAGQLWAVLPSTGNQMGHRAHDRSKVSRHTFVTYSEWESAQATLFKKVDPCIINLSITVNVHQRAQLFISKSQRMYWHLVITKCKSTMFALKQQGYRESTNRRNWTKEFRFLFIYPNEANLVWQIVQRHNQRHGRGILPLSAGFKPESLGSQSLFQMEKHSEHFRDWRCLKNGAEGRVATWIWISIPVWKSCRDPDSNRGCCDHNAEY